MDLPESQLRYGSILIAVTLTPYDLKILPIDAEVIPLPMELTTPPVTTIYFDKLSTLPLKSYNFINKIIIKINIVIIIKIKYVQF